MEPQNLSTRPSREQMRKERKSQRRTSASPSAPKSTKSKQDFDKRLYDNEKVRIRIFPIWLRILLVFAFSIIAVFLGLTIGYAVLGDGSFTDIFKMSTWTHIFDLVLKE